MEKGKKKTGIMGGTFNPIHIGHLLLAENAKDTFGLDEVLFIPSGFSYMKKGMEMADKRIRLEMTQLAIEDNPSFLLSPVEVEREGNSYTCDTGSRAGNKILFYCGGRQPFCYGDMEASGNYFPKLCGSCCCP